MPAIANKRNKIITPVIAQNDFDFIHSYYISNKMFHQFRPRGYPLVRIHSVKNTEMVKKKFVLNVGQFLQNSDLIVNVMRYPQFHGFWIFAFRADDEKGVFFVKIIRP